MGVRRTSICKRDIESTLSALTAQGLTPALIERRPDGSMFFHMVPPAANLGDAVDIEIADFEARHGQGRS